MTKENFKDKEKLVVGPRWVPDTKTDWLTVDRNLTSSSTSTYAFFFILILLPSLSA
jgi:hypothetical protein